MAPAHDAELRDGSVFSKASAVVVATRELEFALDRTIYREFEIAPTERLHCALQFKLGELHRPFSARLEEHQSALGTQQQPANLK